MRLNCFLAFPNAKPILSFLGRNSMRNSTVLLFLLLLLSACGTRETHNHQRIIQDAYTFGLPPDNRDFDWHRVSDLETDGSNLFLVVEMQGIMELDQNGRLIRIFGRPEEGSKRLSRILGQAITPDLVWAMDTRRHLTCFDRKTGELLYDFKMDLPRDRYRRYFAQTAATNSVVGADHQLLFPMGLLKEDPKNIATVFDAQGEPVRHIIDPDYRTILEDDIYTWRRTLWDYHNGYWYCVYMHDCRIAKYDSDFNKIYDVTIRNPNARHYLDSIHAHIANGGDSMSPHYWDMDVFGDSLYLLHQQGVDQFSIEDGRFERTIIFWHEEELMFNGAMEKGGVGFTTFSILDNGQVILAPFDPNFADQLYQSSIPN